MRLSQSSVSSAIKQKYNLDGINLEDIAMLSIGTGQTGEPYLFDQLQNWRLAYLRKKFYPLLGK